MAIPNYSMKTMDVRDMYLQDQGMTKTKNVSAYNRSIRMYLLKCSNCGNSNNLENEKHTEFLFQGEMCVFFPNDKDLFCSKCETILGSNIVKQD